MYVRTACEKDLAAVRELLVEAWHATYDAIYGAERVGEITDEWHALPSLRANLARPESEFILADDGAAIAGMAFAATADEASTVFLHQLYVRPSFQGRGIGGLLMDEMEQCFPAASKMRLEVEEANDRAIRFYLSRGFVSAGRTANCGRPDSGIPAAVLEKRLG